MAHSDSTDDAAPEIRGDSSDQMSQDVWCLLFRDILRTTPALHAAPSADEAVATLKARGLLETMHRALMATMGGSDE